jgi:ferredoxin-NADP reductase
VAAIDWQIATIDAIRDETAQVKSYRFALPAWPGHKPGQHIDLRLTADDGYQAQRSYSIASAPTTDGSVDITVERVPDGEVSPFLHDVAVVGDRLELRGPIGGYFVWDGSGQPDPLLLVAGGSGVVPLMAMVRHHAAIGSTIPTTLLYSSRSADDIIYSAELDALAARDAGLRVVHTLTRAQPPGWNGYSRRVDRQMLAEVLDANPASVQAFVCGPTPLVESVAESLVGLGMPPARVRTERFGPSGA